MNRVWTPQAISIFMLLIAFNPSNPYGYYILLRIILCASCAYLALHSAQIDNKQWVWILGVTAFIYNPLIPIHLTKDLWTLINALTIIMLIVTFRSLRKPTIETEGHGI